jgi:hypothetical protein
VLQLAKEERGVLQLVKGEVLQLVKGGATNIRALLIGDPKLGLGPPVTKVDVQKAIALR